MKYRCSFFVDYDIDKSTILNSFLYNHKLICKYLLLFSV